MSLSDAIRLAQEYSLEAKMARFSFLGSYWSYKSYRAELLPSASLSGALLNDDRSVTSVRNYDDGRINYVENNSLSNSLTLSVRQNIVATGGTVSLQSYLYRLDQFNYDLHTYNTQPLRLVYEQPLRSFNSLKWRGKSEPVAYERAKRQYLETMQNIAVMVTNVDGCMSKPKGDSHLAPYLKANCYNWNFRLLMQVWLLNETDSHWMMHASDYSHIYKLYSGTISN